MGRNEDLCMREVIKTNRFTKFSNSKMRPKIRVYDKCQLSCGHEAEKIRGKHQNKPPVRMSCEQCKQLELAIQS